MALINFQLGTVKRHIVEISQVDLTPVHTAYLIVKLNNLLCSFNTKTLENFLSAAIQFALCVAGFPFI